MATGTDHLMPAGPHGSTGTLTGVTTPSAQGGTQPGSRRGQGSTRLQETTPEWPQRHAARTRGHDKSPLSPRRKDLFYQGHDARFLHKKAYATWHEARTQIIRLPRTEGTSPHRCAIHVVTVIMEVTP